MGAQTIAYPSQRRLATPARHAIEVVRERLPMRLGAIQAYYHRHGPLHCFDELIPGVLRRFQEKKNLWSRQQIV